MTIAKPFDAARYLTDDETIRHYLSAVFEAGDPATARTALHDVARAKGIQDIARDAGMTRKALEQALADEHVDIGVIFRIVHALGFSLTVVRTESPVFRRIVGARYNRSTKRLHVDFLLGVTYKIPVRLIETLVALEPTAADLKDVEVSPRGRSVRFPRLGVKIRVPDIQRAISGESS
jgi:probable addiction module antidote protein